MTIPATISARLRGVLLAALLLPLSMAAAQVPKVGGDWYEDSIDFGFKVKVPKDWDLVPAQPSETRLVARYSPPRNSAFTVGKGAGHRFGVMMLLLVFDDRGAEPAAAVRRKDPALEWMESRINNASRWRLVDEDYPKPLRVRDVEDATYAIYEARHASAKDDPEATIYMYVASYDLEPGLRVCLLGDGPGDRKWRSYERSWEKAAKSFRPVEIEEASVTSVAAGGSLIRAEKRSRLEREVAKLDGWELLETDNYFIVTDVDDRKFLKELMEKVEAIREVYEADYPAEEARAITKKRAQATAIGAEQAKPSADDDRSISAIDPTVASRSSVLRVCSSQGMYFKYGGSPGSAGYWNSAAEELVIYDDKPRSDTWLVLNHEAFHQYIYYFYGAIAPHSWYNEGTGDFYSGYVYKHRRFTLKEAPWRVRTVQGNLRNDVYVPLQELVTWTQAQYYGKNEQYGVDGGDNYAQGWSLIYFLRTGPDEKPDGWDPAWGNILGTYLEELATSGDLDKAVSVAFEGVDWEELEEAWKEYTLSL